MTQKIEITRGVVAVRKRIRQHLVEIEEASWAGDNPDPVQWRAEVIDDVALDGLAARLLADFDVERLRGIEQRATEVAAGLGSRAKSARHILGDDDDL